MSDSVQDIAQLITEDPDVFTKYQDKFSDHTVLDEEIYGEIVGILKDVAKNNGLVLDHRKLKVKFNPAGITLKNIHLECPDSTVKRDLANRVAEITGDDNIKHTFNKNLRVNLYNAINREFADRVRDELNLEVTHQSVDPNDLSDTSDILPMATFTQPAVRAEKPEEELEPVEPVGGEPEGGPIVPPEEIPEPANAEVEVPPSDESTGEATPDIEVSPYGLEEPEEPEDEEPAPPPKEGESMLSFEGVQRIANMLTEDPDIFIND